LRTYIIGVGNLSLVGGQKRNLHGMAGRTNFPPLILSIWQFMMLLKLGNLCNYNVNSWLSTCKGLRATWFSCRARSSPRAV